MLLLDDLLAAPVKGLLWVCRQIQEVAERDALDEEPVHQALLELELACEEGTISREAYEARQSELMSRLRELKEARRMAEAEPEPGPISGPASLEIDLDLDGYGPDGEVDP